MPKPLLEGAVQIVRTLSEAGHRGLFAGGVVRDLLLGNRVSDIDIATSAVPADIERLFPRTIAVGKQFGVMIVVIDSNNYEVATFRTEGGYMDGRHPSSVRFTGAEEDARRRDFTVNALFLDPIAGVIIDYAGGIADLDRRVIRTVGSPADRLDEDKLRVLRAVRFACQLGFQIEARTYDEVKRQAGNLLRVSWERIRDELLKILSGPAPARGLDLLSDSGILDVILPEVAAMRGVPQPPEFHPEGDVFVHTRLMFEKGAPVSDPNLALAVLLHDVGKPPTYTVRERIRFDGHDQKGAEMAEIICRRLRLPGNDIEEVTELVREHLRFIPVHQMRESTLKRFLRKENIQKHLELHRLDCLASHGELTSYNFCLEKLEEFSREAMRPEPLINGHDLIAMGLAPGPLFSEMLAEIEDQQLEGKITTRDEALAWIRSRYLS
ncbi:MAG: CCA tRNA nucleotidyltransferase [Acidobacteria bacterium]|nr:MAG: CCA tRNA nucleotidyltransferase [Acidobacteriota bacterium]